ncbi:reverse transcriptase [Phytophthora megakarya]|uniref:Reverse transcriptase n=1 Tax=Phytophthora megakarya TaxID=4795 RepID=A0A225VRG4_9STRA|nr:reverse transcriptase [Phytophthora megakarya]
MIRSTTTRVVEDLAGNLAVLPEVPISTTAKVSIEDLQVGDAGSATPEEIEKLRQIIWKKQHLLIGKGNALPPVARDVVCDIDVGDAKPIALRSHKVPTRFREKVAGLIKGRDHPTFDIAMGLTNSDCPQEERRRYQVVHRLQADKWDHEADGLPYAFDQGPRQSVVVLLTGYDQRLLGRAYDGPSREISAFITPFGLFKWNRMPFVLKNAPQIYQRLVDNTLYGFMKIPRSGGSGNAMDVFQTGTADDPDRHSVLGRRSNIDDIMVAAESWYQMCQRVEDLMEAYAKISGTPGVDRKSRGESKCSEISDRSAIPRIASIHAVVPGTELYSRFIEDNAIYVSVLYELREVEFAELEKRSDLRKIMDQNNPIARDNDPPEPHTGKSLDESS